MRSRATDAADLAAGIFVVLLGVVSLWAASAIPTSPIYAQVGPKAIPYVVAAGLLVLGVLLVAVALRGGWSADLPEVAEAGPANRPALAWLLGGLAINLALIVPLGFSLAASAQFVCTARAFGSRTPLRDAAVALAVSLGAFFLFVELLGVNIGAGVLEGGVLRLFGQEVS